MAYLERGDEDEFYFRDFNFYQLELKSRFSFLRVPQLAVFFWLLMYYFGSAILFCSIMKNLDVCEATPYAYGGWLRSIYFASVTMSTVGYVDLSLVNGPPWQVFIGILFMLISVIVGVTVFGTAAEMMFGCMYGWNMYAWIESKDSVTRDQPLYKQFRRLVWLRAAELTTYFLALSALGVFVAWAFVNNSEDPEHQWNWMTTI